MSAFLAEVQRFLLVDGVRAVEITHCYWCTDDAVCTACSAKADQVRALVALFNWLRKSVRP